MEKKIKITTAKQFEELIQQLENNPSLAKGFHRGTTPNNFKQEWEEIANKLNSIGPPIRDSDGWQKVWRDFKCKVKRKLMHNKAEVNATGGGICKLSTLSPLEEAAANLVQFQKQFNPEGSLQGIQSSTGETARQDISEAEFVILEDAEDLPSTSADAISTEVEVISKKRKRNENRENSQRNELFAKHNSMQKQVFGEISNTMKEIKDILKETRKLCEETKTALKDTSRYQRKLWEVEEKKLKLTERQQHREDELFEKEIQLKNIKLQIKKKELEVLDKH